MMTCLRSSVVRLVAGVVVATLPLLAEEPAKKAPDAETLKKLGGITAWMKVQRLHEEGTAAFNKADGELAIRKFTECLEAAPRFHLALLGRGRTYYEMRRMPEALVDFERLVKDQPDFTPGRYYRGMALWNLQRREEALPDLSAAIAAEPRNPGYRESRATLLEQLKRPEDVLEDLDRLVSLQPGRPSHLERRAALLRELGRSAEAEEDEIVARQMRDAGF